MRSSNTNLVKENMKAGRRDFFFQYLLLFVILIFCVYQYSVHKLYGFSVYPDEFGYWASAAQWLGYDWSNVASLGYYYSFGYSLILTPILWFCHDGITAYRVAVFINMGLQCVSVGLLWGIFRRIYPLADCGVEKTHTGKMQIVFAVGVAVFYPAWTFYTQMTLTEALLAFLHVFICYQFVLLLEDSKTIRVILRTLLLAMAFLYLYFVHMRTVGFIAAAVLVLTIYLWNRPQYRRALLVEGTVLVAGGIIGVWIKGVVTGTVYAAADAGNLAANDYAGRFRSLQELLTINGMKQFFQSCAGKLYYLVMASFGLLYPAVGLCIKRAIVLLQGLFRKNVAEERKMADWFYSFLLFSALGQFIVTAVFARGSGRLDGIVYGRYNEYLLPVFMGIGILTLLKCRYPWKMLRGCVGISAVLFAVSFWVALQSESTNMRGIFATGLNYLSKSTHSYQVLPEFPKAYLFGILLMVIMYGSVCIVKFWNQNICTIAVTLLIELLLTVCLCRKYTWAYNDSDYYDLKVYEYINEYEVKRGNIDVPVLYLYGGGTNYVALLQFAMQDKEIEVLREREIFGEGNTWGVLAYSLPKEGFLIVDSESTYLTELEEMYEKCVESNSFVLFMVR